MQTADFSVSTQSVTRTLRPIWDVSSVFGLAFRFIDFPAYASASGYSKPGPVSHATKLNIGGFQ